MKKTVTLLILCSLLFFWHWSPMQAATTTTNVSAGDIIKTENSATVYYIGDDLKRHIFPNANVYKSWYPDYSGVRNVSSNTLQQYPLSSVNVTHKPGAKLVKITTDPKVYAVGANGILHWIKSEALARALYGNNWNKQVEDLPDQFFTNYEIGTEINTASDFNKEQEKEAVPEIRMNLVNLKTTPVVSNQTSFNGDYTITYDLSQVEVAILGNKATMSLDSIKAGQAKVGQVDLPAAVADKIEEYLSHQIKMTIAERGLLGVRTITKQNLDQTDQPTSTGLYTERSQNFVFGKLGSIDPVTKNCGILGGALISGHFTTTGIEYGKSTIGFIAGCQSVLVAARATIKWTAVKGLVSQPTVPVVTPPAAVQETFKLKSLTTLKNYAKDVDWQQTLDKILTAKLGDDDYYDVMVMNSDGSNEQCLTCNKTAIPQKHLGNASWYPTGEYIVFTGEKNEVPRLFDSSSKPGIGYNCDLYLAKADGSQFWPIYTVKYGLINAQGTIHPQFSHNGKMLLWAERLGNSDQPELGWGEWALKLADFSMTNTGPVLSNIRTLQPGEQHQFYESHAFSADDTKIIFSGNLKSNQLATGLDIYEYTISTGALNRLTTSLTDWDEHAHWSPDQSKIAWISSTGFTIEYPSQDVWGEYLKTELWLMKADGTQKTQITHYNTSGYTEYKGGSRVIAADSAWGPDGKHLVMAVAYADLTGGHCDLVIAELEFDLFIR